MSVNENQTMAGVILGLGGRVIYTLGMGTVAVGTLYAVNRISNIGVRGLELLPQWITPSKESDRPDAAVITRKELAAIGTSYVKIAGTIVAGGLVRIAGDYMSRESTIAALNSILYHGRV